MEIGSVYDSAKTYIIIPVKNHLPHTQRIVRQLAEQGEYDELLIFDNGSDDGTWDWLTRPEQLAVCRPIPAPGWNIHRMWNTGVRTALEETLGEVNVGIWNNDLDLLSPNIVSTCVTGLRYSEEVGGCSPMHSPQPFGQLFLVDLLFGYCFFFKGELARGKGPLHELFDEQFTWWYGDTDFFLRIREAGLKQVQVSGTHFKHYESASSLGSNLQTIGQTVDFDKWKVKWDKRGWPPGVSPK